MARRTIAFLHPLRRACGHSMISEPQSRHITISLLVWREHTSLPPRCSIHSHTDHQANKHSANPIEMLAEAMAGGEGWEHILRFFCPRCDAHEKCVTCVNFSFVMVGHACVGMAGPAAVASENATGTGVAGGWPLLAVMQDHFLPLTAAARPPPYGLGKASVFRLG